MLRVEDLRIQIRRRHDVIRPVDGVSFAILPGETVGLVGESGCGKTMTGSSIMRLLPAGSKITSGCIRFGGRDLAAADGAALRRVRGNDIGMIFQEPMTSLNPVMTVGRQVAEPVRLHRWYRGSNRFASHILGAYDDGRRIFIDTPVATANYFPFFPDLSGAPYDPARTKGYLSRWTIDTQGEPRSFTEQRFTDHAGEFPRMDDRFETLPYSWGVLGMYDVPGQRKPGAGFRWIGTVDLAKKTTKTHYVGDASTTGEPLFVPAHDEAGQAEGYVVVVVGRHDEMRSDLLILDAQRIDAPPVATVKLPIRIPYGLHGNWVSTLELRKGPGSRPPAREGAA